MANMINNLQKALRHHIPMIQFRYGLNQTSSNSSTHSLTGMKNESKTIDKTSSTPNQLKSNQKSTTTFEFLQIPKKYRRRPLTQAEIDLVAIGGF
ncbi:unnamed protein product [Adineta steineri]|uniref:Ribosomal protein S36 n=1 Tax=Adineta steineri TaxID=433720 RepID=A0A818ZQL0_9BILA|nr:unnamed protein product [Adineta steineri]CAF3770970.1 unnamed protein product [Adineta steineri]